MLPVVISNREGISSLRIRVHLIVVSLEGPQSLVSSFANNWTFRAILHLLLLPHPPNRPRTTQLTHLLVCFQPSHQASGTCSSKVWPPCDAILAKRIRSLTRRWQPAAVYGSRSQPPISSSDLSTPLSVCTSLSILTRPFRLAQISAMATSRASALSWCPPCRPSSGGGDNPSEGSPLARVSVHPDEKHWEPVEPPYTTIR